MSPGRSSPPAAGLWILHRLLPPEEYATLEGDFRELHEHLSAEYGRRAAAVWFWRQITVLVPRILIENLYWNTIMFKSYLRIAWRVLAGNPVYGGISVVGLAVGLTCCALILLFVVDEFSYDRFHVRADDIHRLRVERYSSGGEEELTSTSAAPMMPAALDDVPQIESATRIDERSYPVRVGDVTHTEDGFFWADSTFFDVFSVAFIRGSAESALVEPYSVVLTESTARKYFGASDPLGRIMTIGGRDLTVTGVVRDWPEQSHFDFDFLGSFTTLESIEGRPSTDWNWWSLGVHTYLLLDAQADPAAVGERLLEMPSRYIGEQESQSGYRQFLYLQPLVDIHLASHYRYELEANGQRSYVYIFAAVALFILLIACVNFMNLSTARSAERAREVGMRKVCGAERRQLIAQFLGESLLTAFASFALSLLLIKALLPVFNRLAGKELALSYLQDWPLTVVILAGSALTGLLAGLYPAFVLSGFRTGDVLKDRMGPVGRGRSGSVMMRQGLVIVQFTISITLIIGAIVAQRQLGFMRSADLGFDKEQTLVIDSRSSPVVNRQYAELDEAISRISAVRSVSVSSSVPGRTMGTNVAALETGMVDDGQTFNYLAVDYDFIDQFDLEVIAGRSFSEDFGSDDSLAWILNETAYRALGWNDADEAVGREMTRQFSDTRTIVGVVRDFNYQSLQHAVDPLVLFIRPQWYNYASVRLEIDDLTSSIESLEAVWADFAPELPMRYFFLDEDFDRQYRSEERISGLLGSFTTIAIIIACLGLFALASHVAHRRRKEIGVRKVLGATSFGIVFMLSRSFARLVLIATVLAFPLSWYATRRWLENFENRIEPGWDIFVIAGLTAFSIAMVTISYQAVKAASANPALTLRSD